MLIFYYVKLKMNKVLKKTWEEYIQIREIEDDTNDYYISGVPKKELYQNSSIISNGNIEKEYNFDIIIINDKAYSIVNFLFRDENLEELLKKNTSQTADIIILNNRIIKKRLYGIINTKKTVQFFCETLKLTIEPEELEELEKEE